MELTKHEQQILIAYAECDMNTAEVSKKLYMHRNTIKYHLDKICKKTGLNPNKFYDLIKLLKIISKGE